MGQKQLYGCRELAALKQMMDLLEELWEEIEVEPVSITLHVPMTTDRISATVKMSYITDIIHVLDSSTEVIVTSADTWIHNPVWEDKTLSDKYPSVRLSFYQSTSVYEKTMRAITLSDFTAQE